MPLLLHQVRGRDRGGPVNSQGEGPIRCLRPIVPILLVVTICWAGVDAAHAGRFLHHKKHLTVQQKVAYFQRSLRHERQVVAWLESRFAPRTLERHTELRWYQRAIVWHSHLLAQYRWKLVDRSDLSAWMCIHLREGSWTDSGAPFWGGLQMDYGFQQTYGPELLRAKGTADHWTPAEQIMVARRARDSGRGYGPWPNTARACGLL